MKRLLFATLLTAAALAAQTVETIPFRAILSNANEVPPTTAASGGATVLLHVVRDASGAITSGSADAIVSYKFPGAATITAMHIHQAPAGVNGAIILPWTIVRLDDSTGVGAIPMAQTNFPSAAVSLDIVNQILANPAGFYFNVHTTDAPGGAMRGQLQRAETYVRMGMMSPLNETPPISGNTWAGTSITTTYMTRRPDGTPTSALVIFDLAYRGFSDDASFTGFHIHLGPAGVAGPVTINTGLRSVPGVVGGAGSMHYEVEADVSQQPVIDTLNALAYNPAATYINAHTTVAPGGAIRSQLIPVDQQEYQVTMSSANEVPPVAAAATAPALVTVYSVRNADGTAAAGAVRFDTNPRLPAGTTPTAMHIHDGLLGVNGPVTIDSSFANAPVLIADGTGNITRLAIAGTGQALASLNDVIINPEKHYVNMHSTANPGGIVRAQLVTPSTAAPKVTFAETGTQDPRATTVAPGGMILLAGSNLGRTLTSLIGTYGNDTYPTSLGGVQVTIGGKAAPLLIVAPDRIFAQVPFETATGSQPVVVTTANGASAPFNVTVAASAPSIYINENGALAARVLTSTFVSPDDPARAGEAIAIFATGLGQTTPAQQTGKIAASGTVYSVNGISARIGGQNAPVLSASAVPGYAGVYAVIVQVPQGLAAGNQPVMLISGAQTSVVESLLVR